MRKIYILLLSFFVFFASLSSLNAQVNGYIFTAGTGGTLEDMSTGTTVLTFGDTDDGSSAGIPIGFNFTFNGNLYTQFSANVNGFIRLGTAPINAAAGFIWVNEDPGVGFTSTANHPKLAPYYDDVALGTAAGGGKVHYKVVGTAPNQKLVVEWFVTIPRNLGGAANGKFQLWLEEGTNKVTFIYGNGMVLNTDNDGYTVGIASSATDFQSVTTATNTADIGTHNFSQTNAITSGVFYEFFPPPPCVPGSLAGGTTQSSAAAVCPGVNFNLSVASASFGAGLTYQWESSTDGVTFTPIPLATGQNLITNLTASTYYHRVMTCGASNATSSDLLVTLNPPTECYCVSASTNTTFEYLGNITVTGGINNSSGASSYTNFTTTATPSTVYQGQPITITITEPPAPGAWFPTDFAYIFIDYNQDGDFEDSDELVASASGNDSYTINFVLSPTATLGTTRLRIRFGDTDGTFGPPMSNAPCGSYTFGETEDYRLIITAPPPCAPPSALISSAITNTGATISWTAAAPAPADGYEWEVRSSGAGGSGAAGLVASGTVAAGVVTTPVAGLSANTAYTFYVRSVCIAGSVFSVWEASSAFTTLCDPISIPFTENFANYGTTFPPTCWTENDPAGLLTGQSPSAYTTGVGSAKFDFYNGLPVGVAMELITPQFNAVPAGYFLAFDHAYATFAGEVDELQILYSTDGGATYTDLVSYPGGIDGPLNTAGAVAPGAFNLPTGSQWATKTIALPVGTNKLLFRGVSAFGNNLFLDNILITSCVPPTDLAVSAVTQTTATLNWTASTSAPADGYDWEVRTSGAAGSGATGLVTGGTAAAGTTSVNVTGLTAFTTYSYYVRSACGGGDFSVWAGPFTFTTPCNPIAIPFAENFAGFTTQYPPLCWNRNNTLAVLGQAPSAFGAGTGSTRFDFFTASAGTILELTSPEFTPVTGAYFLAFDHAYATFAGEVDELQILYSINGGSTYTNLITYSGGASGPLNTGGAVFGSFVPTAAQWATKIIALPAGTNKLLFRGVSAWGNNLYVDNILITSCLPPTALTITGVTQTTAALSWTASVSTPGGYEWEVRTSGTGGSGATGLVTSGTSTTTTANATGLTANTTYGYYVRSSCGSGDFSVWTGPFTFTTPCNPFTLPFIEPFAGFTTPTSPVPTCWSLGGNTGLLFGFAPSAYSIGSGSALFDFFDAQPGTVMDLISPEFAPVTGNYFLSFDHAYATFTTEVDQLEILYSTNAGSTYTSLIVYLGGVNGPLNTAGAMAPNPFINPTASQWANKLIALPAGTNRLLFRGTSAWGNVLYIDNILVTSCLPPTGLTTTAIAPNTATLSWTASASLPSGGYEWEVRTSGAAGSGATGLAASGTTAAGATTANVTGLTSYTTYNYYVRSVCGGGDFSLWAGPFTFTTPCDPIAIPFTETFATFGTTFPPTCWLRNNSTQLYGESPSAFGLGNGSVLFDFFNAAAGTELELTSPLFTPVPAGYGLTFDHAYATFFDEVDELEILYSLDGGNTYTSLATYLGGTSGPLNTGGAAFGAFIPTASQWASKIVLLPVGTNRILFRGISDFGSNLYLDNITVTFCLPPTALTITSLTPTTAGLSWTASTSNPSSGYQWEVRSAGAPGTGSIGLAASGTTAAGVTTASVTGLTAYTSYSYYVRSSCGGTDFSVWAGPFAFTTPCNPVPTPIIENFATYSTTFPPTCWLRNNATFVTGQAPSGFGLGSGSAMFEFFTASAGTNLELVSPLFNPLTAGYGLIFDHAYATWIDGSVDNLEILYSTDGGTTYTNLITYAGGTSGPLNTGGTSFGPFTPTASQWATKVILLPAGANRLLFRGVSGFGNNLYIDNINITSCLPPTALTVGFTTQTTAALNWTASISAPANGYQWEIRTSGVGGSGATGLATSGSTATGVTTATATGLIANTTYSFYVRSDCGGETSIWAGPVSFTTPCDPIGVPFIETFAGTFPPNCWRRNNNTQLIGSTASAGGIGTGSAKFDFYAASAGTNLELLSPQFTAVSASYYLTFDHAYATFTTEVDQLQILYSTDAGATFTSLITYAGGTSGPLNTGGASFGAFTPTGGQWATKIIALPAGTNKLLFRGTSQFGNNLYLDNINITSCLPPTGLGLSNIAPTAVTLSWTASTSTPSNGYIWEVRSSGAAGSGATGLVASGTTAAGVTTAAVTGLTASTNYTYYVRSDCGGSDFSIWAAFAFSTPCNPIAVPFTETFASSTFPPTCWTRNNTFSLRNAASAYGVGTGSAKFDFYAAGAGTRIELTTPLFNALPAGYGLVFDHAYATFTTEVDQLEVLYSTNGGGTYTTLTTYAGGAGGPLNTGGASFSAFTPTAAQWSNKAIILPAGTNRILFRGISAFGNNLYLDNIQITSCLPPTTVRATGITPTSVQVSFVSTNTSFIVEYGPVGFTPGTGATAGGGTITTGTGSPITITGLNPSTAYDFYVRSECTPNVDYSANIKVSTSTLCAATGIPHTQNLESAIVPAIPTCTSIQTIQGNPWTVQNNPGSGFTTRTLRYAWNSALAANSWFYIQGLNLTAGTTYRVTYRYGNNSTFYTEKLKVAFGNAAVASAMTTTIADHPNVAGGVPNTNMVDFTPTTSGIYYIGFQAYSNADQFYLFVDDINVKVAPLVDVGATGIIALTCPDANGVVKAIIRNHNLTTLNYATYPITITGTLSGASSGTINAVKNTGTLAAGAFDTIPLSGFNYVAGLYNITVTTSSPDDPETANDSYTTSFYVNPSPAAAIITPATPAICAGDSVQLTTQFTTPPAPPVTMPAVTSGTISVAVPDNSAVGANHSLAVSGIPLGATITGVSVSMIVNHTWISDIQVNLKAPNGKVLNLFNRKGAAFEANLNTTISSAATTPIPATGAPFTGTFAPDAAIGVGPTGFVSDATGFSQLTNFGNGNWTIALRDNVGFDVGTLTTWSITITYAFPHPNVTWSPTTGLFTDAATTTAYAGQSVYSLYAEPTGTTTYTVTSTHPVTGCVSTSTVTVTVRPLPVITIAALPTRICISDQTVPLSATPVGGTWTGIGVTGNTFNPPLTAVNTFPLTYTYTDQFGCTNTASVSARVEDCPERMILLRNGAALVYPNPNSGQFTVKMNSTLYNKLTMRVYTNTGLLVHSRELNGLFYGSTSAIDLRHLPAGSYMVQLSYVGGPRTSEKTFNVIITH